MTELEGRAATARPHRLPTLIRSATAIAAVAAAVLLAGGCGGSDAARSSTAGKVLSVREAHDGTVRGSVDVRGYVLVEPRTGARLCEGLAGSYPPQCGGVALKLVGLDPAKLPGADHNQGVVWTGETTLRGTLDGNVLTVA
jgi:hypothetical protein